MALRYKRLLSLAFVALSAAMVPTLSLAESRARSGHSSPLARDFGKTVARLQRHLQGQRGLDLKRVKVVRTFSNDDSLVLSLEYRSRSIGMMQVMTHGRDRPAYVDGAFIKSERYQGKGLGSLMYMVAAKATRDKLGCALGGSTDQSQEAKRLWDRFKRQGLVTPTNYFPSGRPYAFKDAFVESKELKDLFRRHYRDVSAP